MSFISRLTPFLFLYTAYRAKMRLSVHASASLRQQTVSLVKHKQVYNMISNISRKHMSDTTRTWRVQLHRTTVQYQCRQRGPLYIWLTTVTSHVDNEWRCREPRPNRSAAATEWQRLHKSPAATWYVTYQNSSSSSSSISATNPLHAHRPLSRSWPIIVGRLKKIIGG